MMKNIFRTSILIGFLLTTTAYAQEGESPVAKPVQGDMRKFVFLFGRANYFRVLVKQSRCDLVNQKLFASANERFESARLLLAAKYEEKFFSLDMPAGGPIPDQECNSITLQSFSMKVREIEELLEATK